MLERYNYQEFPYVQMSEQKEGQSTRRPVIIAGAGPIGSRQTVAYAAHDLDPV